MMSGCNNGSSNENDATSSDSDDISSNVISENTESKQPAESIPFIDAVTSDDSSSDDVNSDTETSSNATSSKKDTSASSSDVSSKVENVSSKNTSSKSSTTSSKSSNSSNSTSSKNTSSKITSSQTVSSKNESSSSSTSSENMSSTTNSTTEKTPVISAKRAQYSANEYKGYSIWKSSSRTNKYCVDYKGYETFSFDDGENNETSVYNSTLITKVTKTENNKTTVTYRLRRASDGKILFSTDSVENSAVIIPEYYGGNMFKDGFVMVYSKTESYSGVSYKLGFLKNNGNWATNLSEENALLKALGSSATTDFFKNKLYYCGEGMIAFTLNSANYLYDINTDKVSEIQTSDELTSSNVKSIITCGMTFKDGYAAESYSRYGWSASDYCIIYKDGKTETISLDFHDDLHEREGSMFFDRKTKSAIAIGYTYYQEGFSVFDSKGNIIKKIENVTLYSVNGFRDDGTAQIVLENKEGTKYYTVIDIKGDFLFEPIKVTATYVMDADGYCIEANETNSIRQGRYIIIDKSGKVLWESSDWIYEPNYKNGVFYYELNDTGSMINMSEHYDQIIKW